MLQFKELLNRYKDRNTKTKLKKQQNKMIKITLRKKVEEKKA